MKATIQPLLIALTLLASLPRADAATDDASTAIVYQGQLATPTTLGANATYDLTFTLFTASTGGSLVAGPVTNTAVAVNSNGLFSTAMNFGASVFNGSTNWLEVAVRTNGVGAFTTLTPRQHLGSTPQSIFALNAGTANVATTAASFSGTVAGDVAGTQGATVVATVGGQPAANVASGVVVANAATSANVPNTLVKRDGSGSFAADSVTLGGGLHLPFPAIIYSGSNTMMIESGSYYAGAGAGTADSLRLGFPFPDLGNVGLGDKALFSDNAGTFNTAVGEGALQYNTTGSNNTAGGYGALRNNISGSNNKADGYQALYSNTTGINNTANGFLSLFYNTNGSYNSANGEMALFSNTSGGLNTANGAAALVSNTTGNNNSANGAEALYSNTTGNDNTANGFQALGNNTSGSDNTANGYEALYSNTNGFYNTANGVDALYDNTSGSVNTASGYGALYHNTTGSNNTANGVSALFNNTTGSENEASGRGALFYNTIGTNNIAVGYQAGQNLTIGHNNIDIGNSGVVSEGNTIRLGIQGTQTNTYVAGIWGTTLGGSNNTVVVDSYGHLGTSATAATTTLSLPPTLPSSAVGSVPLPYEPETMVLAGRYAYIVCNGADKLQVVDVSTVSNPQLLGSAATDSGAYYVTVAGRYAYVLSYNSATLQVFDISDPAAPVALGSVSTGGHPETVVVAGCYAYVVSQSGNALQIYDVSNPNSPAFLTSKPAASSDSVAVSGRYAYVVGQVGSLNYFLQVFDVGNPADPVLAVSMPLTNAAVFVTVSGRYAYVTGGSTLQVFDISNPFNPILAGTVVKSASNLAVPVVADRYVYVADMAGASLLVFDVSNPARPALFGSIMPTAAIPSSVAVSGRYVYLTAASGSLQIFDLGGAFIQQLEAGTIETGNLQTRDDVTVGNNLNVRGGLTVSASAEITSNLCVFGNAYATGFFVTSDRNAKENFAAINVGEVLAKVAALPVTAWNYKRDNKTVQHIGPMAQDFQAAFQLSADDKHISVVDEGGVALAAIQGLNEKLQQKDAEITELKQGMAELKAMVQSIAAQK